jgi:sulfhydrogenase subunit beta (sulfur reductase)
MNKLISDSNIRNWLKELAGKYRVIAPVTSDGVTLFKEIKESEVDSVDLKCAITAVSPKEVFFPGSETIFKVSRDASHEIKPVTVDRETVLFGIRPCDAQGISLIDKAFLAEPKDTLYEEKRNKSILIGLACSAPRSECFCTSVGGGPDDIKHVDVLLTEVPSGYALLTVTDKGKKVSADAKTEDKDVQVPPRPKVELVSADGIAKKMRQVFNDSYWDKVADRCVHCNICAYVCPCCYCFDIRDYTGHDDIDRVRSWESCQSAGFVKIAGGHNPRPTKGSRLRQRWYHKLLYFPDLFGEVKCTGCGRCVRSCPVNIDIREIINDVQKMKVNDGD